MPGYIFEAHPIVGDRSIALDIPPEYAQRVIVENLGPNAVYLALGSPSDPVLPGGLLRVGRQLTLDGAGTFRGPFRVIAICSTGETSVIQVYASQLMIHYSSVGATPPVASLPPQDGMADVEVIPWQGSI